MSGRSILLVHDDPRDEPFSSFIRLDLAALRQRWRVDPMTVQGHGARWWYLGLLFSPRAWARIRAADLVVAWFGSCAPAIIMARLLRRPVVIVCGGADVTYVPEIDYGLDPRRLPRYLLHCLGFHLADRLLLFSRASWRDMLALPGADESRCQVLYLGIDGERFSQSPFAGAQRSGVLTVGLINRSSVRRKGIDTLIEAARLVPEVPIRIAGYIACPTTRDELLRRLPANVVFLGEIDGDALVQEMRRAKVYAQLSFHEGFGMALVEAMACGCRPVVTARGSIPEVAGEDALVVPAGDPAAAAAAIRRAIADNDVDLPGRMRARALRLFAADDRATAISGIVAEYLEPAAPAAGNDHCRVMVVGSPANITEAMEWARHRFPYEEAVRRLPSGSDVLEVGCGSGHGASLLAAAGHRVTAVDPSPQAVAYASARHPTVRFEVASGTALPFPDAGFNAVVCFQVIEHVEDEAGLLAELSRVLRPGGVALITTPNRRLRLLPFQRPWNPYHVREHSANSLQCLLSGFFDTVEIAGVMADADLMYLERRRLRSRIAGWLVFIGDIVGSCASAWFGGARYRNPPAIAARKGVSTENFRLDLAADAALDLFAVASCGRRTTGTCE